MASTSALTVQDVIMCATNKSTVKKLDTDVVLPFIILPILLLLATVSSTVTIIVMVGTGMGVLYIYSRPQQKNRSTFFFYWTISSSVYLFMLYTYDIVFSKTSATLLENITVLILIGYTAYSFYKMKFVADFELALGSSKGKEYSPMLTSDSKYCHICQIEVNERFFHSIWWNCCIFRPNYLYFLAGNVFAFITLLICINISLATTCDAIALNDFIVVPYRCDHVYQDFESALTFTYSIYAIGYVGVIALVLIRQLTVYLPKYSEPQWRKLKSVLTV